MKFRGKVLSNVVDVRTIEREKEGHSTQRFEVTLTAKMIVDKKTMIELAATGLFTPIFLDRNPLPTTVAIEDSDHTMREILLKEGFRTRLWCGRRHDRWGEQGGSVSVGPEVADHGVKDKRSG